MNETTMIRFADHIGETIWIKMRIVMPGILQSVKLVGSESAGIWIQHQGLLDEILSVAGTPAASTIPVIFLPFSELSLAMLCIEKTPLDEKLLG